MDGLYGPHTRGMENERQHPLNRAGYVLGINTPTQNDL